MSTRIVVYGASGYQGRLILQELRRRRLTVVLAGRDAQRLEMAARATDTEGFPRRVAGADDPAALRDAFAGADAVVNAAGPFTTSGTGVARAAIEAGIPYVDTAGEQGYLRRIHDELDEGARRAGVAVVPAATDGGVPGDLLASLLAEELGALEEIVAAHVIEAGGGASQGSLRSVLAIAAEVRSGGLSYADGTWHTGRAPAPPSVLVPGEARPRKVVPFPLPEPVSVPRHVRVRHMVGVVEASVAARLSVPLDAAAVERLPEGPAAEDRRQQRFTVITQAVATDGRRGRGTVTGFDTYGTTAVISAEAAARLAAGGVAAGVLAPAQAFGARDLLDALRPVGLRWSIEAEDRATRW